MTAILLCACCLIVVLPGAVLCCLPVWEHLRVSPRRLVLWGGPAVLVWALLVAFACQRFQVDENLFLLPSLAAFALLYVRAVDLPAWKSISVFLAVCAVFSILCNMALEIERFLFPSPLPSLLTWRGVAVYHFLCWLIVGLSWYPATRPARWLLREMEMPGTWYVFWILPLMFIALNLFMVPIYPTTLYTGRVLQGYIVLSVALLILMFMFNTIFLLMATSLNRNARLRQENQLLSMQQQRYENLKVAIEEVRQARHDIRHHLNQISMLAEADDMEAIKAYLAQTVSRIPDLDMHFCENRAVDSVLGYYCALAKREGIPFSAQIDLPQTLPVDEIDMGLVLSNLLENALEASFRTAPARRQIKVKAYVHAEKLLLMLVENACDTEVKETNGVFRSSKRKGNGVGIQSVRHIAEKNGGASTFTYRDNVFSAKIMLRGRAA